MTFKNNFSIFFRVFPYNSKNVIYRPYNAFFPYK